LPPLRESLNAAYRRTSTNQPLYRRDKVEIAPDGRCVHDGDQMSWRPWYGLVAHGPLGSINRLRQSLYQQLGECRHRTHATEEHDPTRLAEVPD